MAVYRVPQNVEAEDKLIGPFTLRQFIYLIVASIGILLAWVLIKISIYLILLPLPAILIFGFLGIYHREDQPVESYLLAALNYYLKPHRRLWDNEGLVEQVTLTAPKRVMQPRPKNLAAEHGQLEWLSHIMDTRGWSIKRPELTEPLNNQDLAFEDRLVMPIVPAEAEEPLEIHLSDDVLDPVNNPEADRFNKLAVQASEIARQAALAKMQRALNEPADSKSKHDAKAETEPSTPLPSEVEFDPLPQAITQTIVDPKTGKVAWHVRKEPHKKAVKTTTRSSHRASAKHAASHTFRALAKNDQIPISEIARQAKRAHEQAQALSEGQEINLHQTKPAAS